MKKKEEIWTRKCLNPNNNPNCKKEIVYKNKYYYNIASKKNTVCISCASYKYKHTDEAKHKIGKYTKGKTYEQLYGNNANIERKKRSDGNKGKIVPIEVGLKISKTRKENGSGIGSKNPMYGKIGSNKNKKFSSETKRKMRLAAIKQLKEKYRNGFAPNYSKDAIEYFNKLMKENHIYIQHAENGGEYYIENLGYWLDGYDKENNVAYEFDEFKHYDDDKLKQKDINRQKEIEKQLNCKFIRIKSWQI